MCFLVGNVIVTGCCMWVLACSCHHQVKMLMCPILPEQIPANNTNYILISLNPGTDLTSSLALAHKHTHPNTHCRKVAKKTWGGIASALWGLEIRLCHCFLINLKTHTHKHTPSEWGSYCTYVTDQRAPCALAVSLYQHALEYQGLKR